MKMNRERIIMLKICRILLIVSVLCSLSFANSESGTNSEAEQHFEKANELRKLADYEAAITEYKSVIKLLPHSRIAQDAQYWIGQAYFETGQFDAALSEFKKLLDEYPDSAIIASTKLMIERIQQAKNTKALFEAVKQGDIEQVKKLISEGADVNGRNSRSQNPLHCAARAGNEQIARLLIAEGADVNASMGDEPWTPLLDAANSGNAKVVKLLLEKGAKVDVGDSYGYTPLYYAIWSEDIESVKMLIAAGADINKRVNENDEYNAFFDAVWMDNADLVKILIDAGADVNYKANGRTPLYHAIMLSDPNVARVFIGTSIDIPNLQKAAFEGNIDKVKEMVESGTDVNTKDEQGWTAAYWALSTGQKDVFEYLLNKGADINIKANDGLMLLNRASMRGFKEIVEQLIAKGVDVDVKDTDGRTPLQIAASGGHTDIVKLLIAQKANVNNISKNGRHPLGDAALAGHEDVVRLLIDSGAEVNLHTENMGTALHAAATGGHSSIVDLLIANGANVNINARNGTPLHLAARPQAKVSDETCAEIVEKLIAKGADVNSKNPQQGLTPLHIAARRGRCKAAELLVAGGANVNAMDNIGHTPLFYAKEKFTPGEKDTKVIELLQKHGAAESLYDAAATGDLNQVMQLISDGADVSAKTDGWLVTPIHVAAISGNEKVCELLIAKGAEVNAKSGEVFLQNNKDEGLTALHAACAGGKQEVAKLLLAHGADVNAKTRNSMTPLDLARKRHNQEVVELLLKYGGKGGVPAQGNFRNAKLIPSGEWLEGSFQDRMDEEWFAIDVEEKKTYLICYDDVFGSGKYTADIDTYLYKSLVNDLEPEQYLFTDSHNIYQEPIKFTSDYNGKLYLRLISDNPQNTTFAIKYDIEK
jgi:ankyrin repeat protein